MKFDPNGGLPDDSTREITPETQVLATFRIGCHDKSVRVRDPLIRKICCQKPTKKCLTAASRASELLRASNHAA